MTEALWALATVAVVYAGLVAFRRRAERVSMPPAPTRRQPDDDEIDYAALEAAERDVQDLRDDMTGAAPEDQPGDDWGPGTK